jgi:hypothetical protein
MHVCNPNQRFSATPFLLHGQVYATFLYLKHLCTPTTVQGLPDDILQCLFHHRPLFPCLPFSTLIYLSSLHYFASIHELPRPPPPLSKLGTAFRPTRLPGISILGTPCITLGSRINVASSCAGIRDTTLL